MTARPPVVENTAEVHVRAAAEVEMLPADSPLAAMLNDYAALREQARACAGHDDPDIVSGTRLI